MTALSVAPVLYCAGLPKLQEFEINGVCTQHEIIDFQSISTTLYCTYYEYNQVMPIMKTCLLSLFVCLSLFLPQAKVFSANLLIVDSLTAEPYTSVRLAMMQELQAQGFSQNSN
ncbi:hypothetical protein, partial [uncultured Paraglaciecola sp.]|uniref:hypothetical protein n=1 Tax=uncultured Paraglaciecola sp. TaxID=1765024 RepID=UPI0025CE7FB5